MAAESATEARNEPDRARRRDGLTDDGDGVPIACAVCLRPGGPHPVVEDDRASHVRWMSCVGACLTALGCASNDVGVYTDGGVLADAATSSFIGSWNTCSLRRTFASDGTWATLSYRASSCRSTGRWLKHGDRVDLHTETSTCMTRPVDLPDARFIVAGHQLMIVHPMVATSGVWRGLDDSAPRQRWRLEGTRADGARGVTILRMVGDPQQDGSGCYWSGDGNCNGVFSCSGTVYQWLQAAGTLGGGLSCDGCTCGASLVGTISAERIAAHFYAQNCKRIWQGDAEGVPEADPQM